MINIRRNFEVTNKGRPVEINDSNFCEPTPFMLVNFLYAPMYVMYKIKAIIS